MSADCNINVLENSDMRVNDFHSILDRYGFVKNFIAVTRTASST